MPAVTTGRYGREEQSMLKPANAITCCRIILSAVLLFLPPLSASFGVIYLVCGLSDAADGWIARKTHTESDAGARLDSAADVALLAVSAVKLLPLIRLDAWIWVWVAVIAAVKIAGMLLRIFHCRTAAPPHSASNKLTGLLLFLLPLTIPLADLRCSATVVCIAASFAAVQDVLSQK